VAPLPARAERRAGPAPGAAGRPGRGGRLLRVHAVLPADRLAQQRGARRVRGPDPVAAPAVGHDAARPVHLPGRGDRADRAARLLGADPGRGGPRPVAAGTARALRQRERVGPPVRRARLRRRGTPRPGRFGPRTERADARADRERAAAPRRPDARGPGRTQGHRPAAGHRRLRHRLLLPVLPAGAAHRRAEDGQVVRGRDRGLRAAPGARRGHRPDRADAPARGHRRGHRKRGPAGPADLDGLPVRAGLPAGHADAGRPGGDPSPGRITPGAHPAAAGDVRHDTGSEVIPQPSRRDQAADAAHPAARHRPLLREE
jgi:hypothetical protein